MCMAATRSVHSSVVWCSNFSKASIGQGLAARAKANPSVYGTGERESRAIASWLGHSELKLGGGNGGCGDHRDNNGPRALTLAQLASQLGQGERGH
jgi:hypothetical protein